MDIEKQKLIVETIDQILDLEKKEDEFTVQEYIDMYNGIHGVIIPTRTAHDRLSRATKAGILNSRKLFSGVRVFSVNSGYGSSHDIPPDSEEDTLF